MICDGVFKLGGESKKSGEARDNHRGSSCTRASLLKNKSCRVSHNTLGLQLTCKSCWRRSVFIHFEFLHESSYMAGIHLIMNHRNIELLGHLSGFLSMTIQP